MRLSVLSRTDRRCSTGSIFLQSQESAYVGGLLCISGSFDCMAGIMEVTNAIRVQDKEIT